MDDFRDEENEGGAGFNPMDILRIFLRRKLLFLIPFALCLGMAYVAIKTMDPIYSSSGEIRVIRRQTASRTINEGTPRYRRSRDADRETEVLIRTTITSPTFLRGVVRDLGLHRSDMISREEPLPTTMTVEQENAAIASLARQLEKIIRVRVTDTHIFGISIRDKNPDLTYLLATEVLNRFLQEEQATRLEAGETERDFLVEQRTILQTNLRDAQEALTGFQRTMLTTNMAGNPVNEGNLARADDIRRRLQVQIQTDEQSKVPIQHSEARTVLPAVNQFLRELNGEVATASLTSDLVELELEMISALIEDRRSDDGGQGLLGTSRLALDNLVERRLIEEYSQLSVLSRASVTRYLYDSLYLDINKTVLIRLEKHITDYRNFMTRQPEQSATMSRLQREVDSAQQMLQSLEDDIRRQSLSMAASMSEIGYQLEVYDEPRRPLGPIEPDKKKLGLMGIALAIGIGVGLVLLAEMMDRTFKNVQQIESALGVPVIGTLPLIKNGPFEEHRRRRVFHWIVIIIVIAALAAVGFLWVYPRFTA